MSDPLSSLHSRWPEKTQFLGQVFNHTAASYKFYWLLGLLSLLQRGRSNVFPQIEIVKEMVVAAWDPVCFYRLSLGVQDKLQEAVVNLRSGSGLKNDARPTEIRPKIESTMAIQERLRDLTTLVPTRFLSPWFSRELRGIDGHTKTQRTIELAAKSQTSMTPTPYSFERIGNTVLIKVNESWSEFFMENLEVIRSFALFHLCRYLQARNPNVPGIINKMSAPIERDLGPARRFWKAVHSEFKRTGKDLFRDIYADTPLDDTFAIDHFLPWSFVAHDLLWNLAPVLKTTNSKKSDFLPSAEHYLPRLSLLHRESLLVMKDKPRMLEDYANWFMMDILRITSLPEGEFFERYREAIEPQLQIAANQGFESHWVLGDPRAP